MLWEWAIIKPWENGAQAAPAVGAESVHTLIIILQARLHHCHTASTPPSSTSIRRYGPSLLAGMPRTADGRAAVLTLRCSAKAVLGLSDRGTSIKLVEAPVMAAR